MPVDAVPAQYVPGDGLLVGTGRRWVLLDTVPDAGALAALWDAVTGTGDLEAAVTGLLDTGVPLAVADLGTGRTAARGGASAGLDDGTDGGTCVLALPDVPAQRAQDGAGLPLLGGAVRAQAVRLRTPAGPAARGALIEGVPPHILAARAPDRVPSPPARSAPAPAAPPVDRTRVRAAPPGDHDGLTVHRPRPDAQPVGGNDAGHLRQATHETVLAMRCPAGHPSPPDSPVCRTCGAAVPPQEPVRVPRPPLGVLRLPDGDTLLLDRGVLLGRRPERRPDSSDWPHLVPLPGDATYLSRVHLQIELDGWLVLARDLGSRAGTTWHVPGREPVRMRAHEAYVIEPGHVLALADEYSVGFEPS